MIKINQKEWIEKLQKEGFREVRVVPLPPYADKNEHTHDQYQIDVVLKGKLTISDQNGAKTYLPGDRVEFPAGTVHIARGGPAGGDMIVGVKEK